jgi:hypothetical protein
VEARCSPPTFLESRDGYRAVGASVPAQTLYVVSTGGCVAANIGSRYQLRALGPIVPRTSLVAFHDENEVLVPGVDAIVKVGVDGSRLWHGDMFDAERGVAAALRRATSVASTDARVLPIARAAGLAGGNCCSLVEPAPCEMQTGEGYRCLAPPFG